LKNEFGHIIKKKVENSTLAPPPMDWKGLSDAQNNAPNPSKSILSTKGLIITSFVSVAVITVLVSLFVVTPDKPILEPVQEPNLEKNIADSTQLKINKIEPDTNIVTKDPSEKKPVLEEKKISAPLRKKKKKDKFGNDSKKNKVISDPDKKTESKTTILYEVDTITTETYIYE